MAENKKNNGRNPTAPLGKEIVRLITALARAMAHEDVENICKARFGPRKRVLKPNTKV